MSRVAAALLATILLASAIPVESQAGRQVVGSTLVVSPTILANGQIGVRLTPQVNYFSPRGDGSIEFNEAAMEVIVPNGRAMRIGGATRGINPAVTRQILGYCEQRATSESSFILTATVQ